MRVPVNLLRPLANPPVDLDTLARVLNARVSEVEAIHRGPSREAFRDVCIVEPVTAVESRAEHTRWRMRTRTGEVLLVVGDRFGVRAGDRLAAVLAGGTTPDGTVIAARAVVGLESAGVVVSEAQLGVGKDAARPLFFAPDTPLDADPWEALDAGGAVLEFDLEPNRPDLFSLLGVARDVGAIWSVPLSEPGGVDLTRLAPLLHPQIELRTPKARHYAALLVRGVRVQASPQWLQNAVRSLGMRPINNVVDAANLTMMELGQPLHTFDAARLLSDRIVLRMAAGGEHITTLDGVDRALTEECLLVCDGETPVAIAGVMGNALSEVHVGTTDVLIEGASFDMASVRRASRRLALRTEASARFEKGLPVSSVAPALARLAALLAEVAGGEPVALAWAGEDAPAPPPIPFDPAYIRDRTGVDVPDREMHRILAAAGVQIVGDTAFAPEGRPDLRIPEDLVEEIGRVHGYEHVVAQAPAMALATPMDNPVLRASTRARRLLGGAGWDEVYLLPWLGDAEVATWGLEALVSLINPLASDLVHFRPSAFPGLVAAVVENRKELERFRLYEIGRVYRRAEAGGVDERPHLAGAAVGDDLLVVRDTLLELARAFGADPTVSRTEDPHLHPGRTLALGDWAVAGELHPRLVRAHGLREAPVLFRVALDALAGLPAPVPHFVPPPRFPSIEVDLNVTVGPRIEAAGVLAAVPRPGELRRVEVRDRYPLADGARLTLHFVWNAGDRSLTAEEIGGWMTSVRGALGAAGYTAS